jgi:putative ABC transport system permease protein
MHLRDAFEIGLANLRARRMTAALTMLGMVFGVGAVIAMQAIGAGAERQALALIDALGMRNVMVQVKEPTREPDLIELRKASAGLSERDARAIAEAVPAVARVVQKTTIETYRVLGEQGRGQPRVLGVSADYADLMNMDVAEGRFLDAEDVDTLAQVCVIGSAVRRDLLGFGPAVGRAIKVNERWLTVVGVLAPARGAGREVEGVRLTSTANDVYVPLTTAQRKFSAPLLKSPLDELVVETKAGDDPQRAAIAIDALLQQLHGGASDYTLVVPDALLEQSRRTQRLFNIVMGCIAGISLIVGGIGIMNIMLATVLERTREIGVRRAVGATARDIRSQFLLEALQISAAGGVLGIVMGMTIAQAVALYAGWDTVVTLPSIVLASGVSVAVGLASGLYPALRAAALDPIEALRYE